MNEPLFVPVEQPEKPPFDFVSDLLLGLALAPSRPLRAAFPAVPFLSVGGRTPLLVWFGQIERSCYWDADRRQHCLEDEGRGRYVELTILAVARRPALFGPALYASSALSERLARRYYGMPKALAEGRFSRQGRRIFAQVGDQQGTLVADTLPGACPPGLLQRLLRRLTWRASFPTGGKVDARLGGIGSVHFVLVHTSRLDLRAPWLPAPISLLPVGLLVRELRMTLAPPSRPPWNRESPG